MRLAQSPLLWGSEGFSKDFKESSESKGAHPSHSQKARTGQSQKCPPPRGTEGSNPSPSSEESANFRFLSKRRASEICRDTAHRYGLQPRSTLGAVAGSGHLCFAGLHRGSIITLAEQSRRSSRFPRTGERPNHARRCTARSGMRSRRALSHRLHCAAAIPGGLPGAGLPRFGEDRVERLGTADTRQLRPR